VPELIAAIDKYIAHHNTNPYHLNQECPRYPAEGPSCQLQIRFKKNEALHSVVNWFARPDPVAMLNSRRRLDLEIYRLNPNGIRIITMGLPQGFGYFEQL